MIYNTVAPTPSGYVVRAISREVPQVLLGEITANVYGDPAARDRVIEKEEKGQKDVPYTPEPGDTAMFTSPADCSGEPLKTVIHLDSWQDPAGSTPTARPSTSKKRRGPRAKPIRPPVTGCGELKFEPSIAAAPDSSEADSPTGLEVNVKVPQASGVESLGTPPVREAVVTLPAGMSVNPAAANGLAACSETQIGYMGKTPAGAGEYEDFNASPAGASAQEETEARAGVTGEPARARALRGSGRSKSKRRRCPQKHARNPGKRSRNAREKNQRAATCSPNEKRHR